ncbi:MAG TPA: SCO family protein [Bdellovibrionales bacterium]|nr:SCO family protein [Bdellovibrionales bacterium]
MNRILFALLLWLGSTSATAHEGHHDENLKAAPLLAGASVWQLNSAWKDQNGASVTLASLTGKPLLVAMLYTRCKTACPIITDDLKAVAAELMRKGRLVDVAIFSLDSFHETPASLSAYAKKRNLPANWRLYTGNADSVSELAGALGVRYKRLKDGEYIHSNVIYYVNKDGEVAAQKEGLNSPSEEFIKKIARP